MSIKQNSFGFIVGVGKRPSDGDAMSITSDDACNLDFALTSYCGFPRENITTLKNEEANTTKFTKGIESLINKTKNSPSDLVIIYFSGHGCRIGEELFLICNDTRNENIPGTGIIGTKFIEMLLAIKAEKMLVLLDCCHSGYLTNNASKIDIPFDKESYLKGQSNRVVITACHESQVSYVSKPVSIFTFALIEALGGKSFIGDDKDVKIFELAMYIRERVVSLSKQGLKDNDIQKPQLFILKDAQTSNFTVVRYPQGVPMQSFFKEDFKLWDDKEKEIDTGARIIKDKEYRNEFKWLVNNIKVVGNGNYVIQGINGSTITINEGDTDEHLNSAFQILSRQLGTIEDLISMLKTNEDRHLLKRIVGIKNRRSKPKIKNKSLEILIKGEHSIKGDYIYTCNQRLKRNHSHGGTCQIEVVKDNAGCYQWRLNGLRKWVNDDGKKNIYNKNGYFSWSTTKAIIFEDLQYIFTYNIGVQEEQAFGFANGSIIVEEKEIRLSGHYYQQDGLDIIWGNFNATRIKKKIKAK